MKITEDNQGYIVLYDTDNEGLVPPTWGLRVVYGVKELEAEISAALNEIESFEETEDIRPGTIDDITIFKIDDSFKFKVEQIERTITLSSVKLEQKYKQPLSLREVSMIPIKIGPTKL